MVLFTIIIPTYNASKTISACVDSVLQQTFPGVEVLIVDGLSTDSTIEIAKSFKDSRIKIVSEKDDGIFDAMNKGIDLAAGEYLFFLGADDVLTQDILKVLTQTINFGEYDLVYGKVQYPNRFCGEEYKAESLTKEMMLNPFIHLFMHHQGTFIRKELFRQFGKYELQYPIGADVHFFMKVIDHPSVKKKYIDKVITRVGDRGISAATEEVKLRYEFPALAKKYLNVDVDNKLYYRTLAKYYFDEIYYRSIIKGLKGILKLCLSKGDKLFYIKNTGYWLKERMLKK